MFDFYRSLVIHINCIPIGAYCALHVVDLFQFCQRDAGVIEAFSLGVLMGVGGAWFGCMVNYICMSELRLGGANSSDAGAPFLDLHFTISDGFVYSKIYDKRDNFDFDVDFLLLDEVFLMLRLAGFICLSSFGLMGCLVEWLALALEMEFWRVGLLKQGCLCRRLDEDFSKLYWRQCVCVWCLTRCLTRFSS